ncbi:Twinkle homolog protein-chloroplastic/mitochondrial, partial [Striga hermonthica]
PGVGNKTLENQCVDEEKEEQLIRLMKKLLEIETNLKRCFPGQYNGLICPKCNGRKSVAKIRSLSLRIEPDWKAAAWTCTRAKCNWKGATQLLAYFAERRISVETLQRNRVMQKRYGDT